MKKIFALAGLIIVLAGARPLMADHARHLSRGLTFCGERVALDQAEVFQAVDQNLVLLAEAKSRIWLTLRRTERYLPLVERELKRASAPADLKYIPLAITGLAPDYNSGGRGMWRLREPEAKKLGLRVDKDVDERLDPAASTAAAIKQLKDLKNSTGSWTMAMAAHLLGDKVIGQAISEAGGETNYYKIYLPGGLDQMPAMVLAGKVIFQDPGAFGYVQSPDRAWPPLSTRRETVRQATTIRELAARHKKDYKSFRDLNPHLLSGNVPVGATVNIP